MFAQVRENVGVDCFGQLGLLHAHPVNNPCSSADSCHFWLVARSAAPHLQEACHREPLMRKSTTISVRIPQHQRQGENRQEGSGLTEKERRWIGTIWLCWTLATWQLGIRIVQAEQPIAQH